MMCKFMGAAIPQNPKIALLNHKVENLSKYTQIFVFLCFQEPNLLLQNPGKRLWSHWQMLNGKFPGLWHKKNQLAYSRIRVFEMIWEPQAVYTHTLLYPGFLASQMASVLGDFLPLFLCLFFPSGTSWSLLSIVSSGFLYLVRASQHSMPRAKSNLTRNLGTEGCFHNAAPSPIWEVGSSQGSLMTSSPFQYFNMQGISM